MLWQSSAPCFVDAHSVKEKKKMAARRRCLVYPFQRLQHNHRVATNHHGADLDFFSAIALLDRIIEYYVQEDLLSSVSFHQHRFRGERRDVHRNRAARQ
jgi:flagellar biosynthesis/type III secretory pathway ATPase